METTFLAKILSEFFGTMIMIVLGNGVMANIRLNRSSMKGAGTVQMSIAWGLAYMVPTIIFSQSTGAHFNPAITIAFLFCGYIKFSFAFFYIIAQTFGAIMGASIVYILFKDQLDATNEDVLKYNVFCPIPSVYDLTRNIIQEAIATFILTFTFCAVQGTAYNAIGIFAVVTSLAMSLGGLSGFALNPARDIGPKIVYMFLPMENKCKIKWEYSIATLIGPILGAILAVIIATSFKYMGVFLPF